MDPARKDQVLVVLALPIFPVRLQTSIFGRSELNFRVRNGNGWTLALINTNLLSFEKESKQRKLSTFLSLPSFSTASSLSNFHSTVKPFSLEVLLLTFSFKKK